MYLHLLHCRSLSSGLKIFDLRIITIDYNNCYILIAGRQPIGVLPKGVCTRGARVHRGAGLMSAVPRRARDARRGAPGRAAAPLRAPRPGRPRRPPRPLARRPGLSGLAGTYTNIYRGCPVVTSAVVEGLN